MRNRQMKSRAQKEVKAKVSSDTATQIVVKVPSGATTGSNTVQTATGAASSSINFTVT
jgi:hypothetical protein